jgi:uncharacterized protein YidB (DUF937 family)
MSKTIVVKISGTVHFTVADLQSDVAEDIRELCGLDPFDAVEDEHIKMYIEEQDIQELVQEFGIDDTEVVEVLVK